MIDLSSLNERQIKAALWQEGPLLVLAGPGSGKTTVLTSRIARIIDETAGDHFRVLGLTFTNKAAAEMRKRIENLVPGASSRFLLTTFHSFAGDLLRQHGHLIGLRPDFTILTQEGERVALLDEALSTVADTIDVSEYSGERLLPLVNRLLENDVNTETVDRLLSSLAPDRQDVVCAAYHAYKRSLLDANSLDFPSMISQALRVVRDFSAVCKQLGRVYRFVCVDEFQDTNLAQYSLLRCLVGTEGGNLFVVADDDQIIYQWNGASPERLTTLRADFKMDVVQLPANYRCPPAVVDIANRLIAHNTSRAANKDMLLALKPNADHQSLRLHRFADFESEVSWVAGQIAARSLPERERSVVLARTRKTLERAIEHLSLNGVPAYFAMRKDEFTSAPLRFVHAALRLANNPQDREQIRRLSKAFYALEGIQIDQVAISSTSEAFEGSALRAFGDLALTRPELTPSSAQYLRGALPLLTDRLDFRGFCFASFLWVEGIQGVVPDTDGHFTDYAEERLAWQSLVDEIEGQFSREAVTLHVLLQELDLRSKTPPPPKGAVPCFTIHASKGMEFGHVYLIAMVEDQLPSWSAVKKGDTSNEMQEERRNCFVAVTRTEDSLDLTYSDRMFGWGKTPSRFLREMGFQV